MPTSYPNLVLNNQVNARRLEEEYLACLRRRDMHSKFHYIGEKAAQRWLAVCREPRYSYYREEIGVLKKYLSVIMEHLYAQPDAHYNFISLGIGNGQKDAIIIRDLLDRQKVLYCPVDIGEYIIQEGLKEMEMEKMRTEAYIADIGSFADFSSHIRQENFPHHFVSILGNTVGNTGQVELLSSIRKGMHPGDFLLVGVSLKKKDNMKTTMDYIDSVLEIYGNPTFSEFAFGCLERAGFNYSDGCIEIEYGPDRLFPSITAVEVFFSLTKDKTVSYLNEEVPFKKGERIRVAFSCQYADEDLRALLDNNGFVLSQSFLSPEKTAGVYLCELKK